ncbi:MAG: carbohydrate ABC transporter permease [Lentisphaeria bacterium]|jgi:multiple sugar transport system permease protein|nr:carbohydrate ABC transporter permease [Lentisphaeria bacterium]
MPIISKIGARNWKVRFVYATIFGVLIAGAVTMIYPLLLMLAGSVKSQTDFYHIAPLPRFWNSDLVLFQKYAESKYDVRIDHLEMAWWEEVGSWRKIEPIVAADGQLVETFLDWRREVDLPPDWYALGHAGGGGMLPVNARLFRRKMYKQYDGDIDACRIAMAVPYSGWVSVSPPTDSMGYSRRYNPQLTGIELPYREFKASRPFHDRMIFNIDAVFWRTYLKPKYTGDINEYNRQHGTNHDSYHEVFLTHQVPPDGLMRQDWEAFVRTELNLAFVRLQPELAAPYRQHLALKYADRIKEYNSSYKTAYRSLAEIPFPLTVPMSPIARVDWNDFITDPQACPVEGITVYGPRQAFEEYVAQRRGVSAATISPLKLPVAAVDYHDAMSRRSALRWEFTTRNYKQVLAYILLHGRGIVNTLIYCFLAISTALLVNPLAAYALSRYKLPATYAILLFCMATMAFPGEVTMIPGFLLLKRFPLWPIVAGVAAFVLALWGLGRIMPRRSEALRMILALGIGIVVGAWGLPAIMQRPNITLLNTFWALILPGMANGFFIFLLKGFFDSLPRELYEAAEIDGAGEWTKFWTITMRLSQPVLAVIALGAFTGAYSAFMMALIIIPDQDMWTLMVWIFQLQSISHQSVVYASLVIAAVPTFMVFVFCQNIIIRGIVVPVEK